MSDLLTIISFVAACVYLFTFEPPEWGTIKSYVHSGALVAIIVVIVIRVIGEWRGVL